MEFKEFDDVLYSDKKLSGTVVNVVRNDDGSIAEYWVELHEGYKRDQDKVVFANQDELVADNG